MCVTSSAMPAVPSAASALPALKPNQPTHSMQAPVTVMVMLCGGIAGVACFFATSWMKRSLKIDDSLDVTPVHGVGGAIGTLLTGVFAASSLGGVGYAEGVTMGQQVLVQITGILAVGAWSGIVTLVLLKLTDAITGMRVAGDEETEGLDQVEHNEKGYNL